METVFLMRKTAVRSTWRFMPRRCSIRSAADWFIPVRLCATSRSGTAWSRNCKHIHHRLEQAVSERTQQLVASQARYKALFDLVADSVFMVNAGRD